MSALVAVHDVDFAYPGAPVGRRVALANLRLTVESGEILGVIGPNSAGKTTIIRLLTKVVSPSRGEIVFDGVSLAGWSRWELARHVAVVPRTCPRRCRSRSSSSSSWDGTRTRLGDSSRRPRTWPPRERRWPRPVSASWRERRSRR